MSRTTLRVRLTPTDQTHLVCIHCGGFRCEFAVSCSAGADADPVVGLHRKCLRLAATAQRGARAGRNPLNRRVDAIDAPARAPNGAATHAQVAHATWTCPDCALVVHVSPEDAATPLAPCAGTGAHVR